MVTNDTTPHVYGKEMLAIAFDSTMWIITIQRMGVSGIVDSIAGKMSRYDSTVPKSATVANRTHVYVYSITFLTQNYFWN